MLGGGELENSGRVLSETTVLAALRRRRRAVLDSLQAAQEQERVYVMRSGLLGRIRTHLSLSGT